MHLAAIIVLMLVLPLLSVAAQTSMLPDAAALMGLVGKWFTLWGVGVRRSRRAPPGGPPEFTAEDVFGIGDPAADGLVREIGFGNLAIGTLGILSLFVPDFLLPARDRRRPVLRPRRARAPRAQGPQSQRAGRVRSRPQRCSRCSPRSSPAARVQSRHSRQAGPVKRGDDSGGVIRASIIARRPSAGLARGQRAAAGIADIMGQPSVFSNASIRSWRFSAVM